MADKKISELGASSGLQGGDEMPLARSGQTLKYTANEALAFYGIKIQTASVGYVPAPTGNPDKNKVAPGSDGFWYLFAGDGAAIKILDLLTGQVIAEDKYYEHVQGVASDTWVVIRNLGKYPALRAVDSAGTSIPIVEITDTDVNSCTLHLAFSASGKVFCN